MTDNQIDIIELALKEDLGARGDVTSLSTIPQDQYSDARVIAKQPGIIAGLDYFAQVFQRIDPVTRLDYEKCDGERIEPGEIVLRVHGRTRSILAAERVALNFLGHLSGVASRTAKLVKLLEGTGVKILDTRKTTPGMRAAEKEAVRLGGGFNHRMALYDMVLIKENHIAAAGGIREAIARAKEYLHKNQLSMEIEIEVRDAEELKLAVEGEPDRIMLDNFTVGEVRNAVAFTAGKIPLEVSGGISESNIRAYAEAGPDYISIGGLTSSVTALDLSMLIEGV